MIRGLYSVASGLITGEAKQNSIMNNMANLNTTGYKSEKLSIKSFDEVMISNRDKYVHGKHVKNNIGTLSNGAEINEKNINFEQGTIKNTENDTDFALEGRGFFVVRRNGQNLYTRDGHFMVNAQGYLLNQNGDLVLGRNLSNNAVEPINVGEGKIASDKLGNLSIDGKLKYKLQLVDFNDYKQLKKEGESLYSSKTNPVPANNIFVTQKALEASNVDNVQVMTEMMSVMRNFESDLKVLKTLDESLGKAVNDIGRVR